jgi:hypothetical protein
MDSSKKNIYRSNIPTGQNIKISLFKKISIGQIIDIDHDGLACTIEYMENDKIHHKTYSHCQKKKYQMCKDLRTQWTLANP